MHFRKGKPCCCDNGDEEQREEGDSAEEVGVQKCCEAHDPAYRYCEQKLLCTVLSKDMEWYTQHYWQARPALEHVKAPETRDDSETSCLANLERHVCGFRKARLESLEDLDNITIVGNLNLQV